LNKEILFSRYVGYNMQYNNCIDTIIKKNISLKAVIDTIVSGLNNPQNDDFVDSRHYWQKNLQTNKVLLAINVSIFSENIQSY
jgi:hypothetical protein